MVFSAWDHATSSMARLKITRGMVNYHAWKRVLTCQEIPTRGSRSHCHAWLIFKQCHVQSLMLRKHTIIILTVLKLIYTVLSTDNSCFTGITDSPVPPMDCRFSAAVNSKFCRLQLQYNVIYYNNKFTNHFFMIVLK